MESDIKIEERQINKNGERAESRGAKKEDGRIRGCSVTAQRSKPLNSESESNGVATPLRPGLRAHVGPSICDLSRHDILRQEQ